MFTPILSIVVIIIGAVVAITEKKDVKYKKYFVFLYVISSCAAIYLIISDYLNIVEDTKQKIIQSNKIDNIEYTASDISLKIDSLDKKTIAALTARESSIVSFNQVTEKLNKQIEFEELDIKSKGPKIIAVSQDIKFIKRDSLTQDLQVKYINMGNRYASNFKDQILCILYDRINNEITHEITAVTNGKDIFPTTESSNHFVTSFIYGFNKEFVKSEDYLFIIVINIKYSDKLLDNLITESFTFQWDSKIKCFHSYNRLYLTKIEKYLKENNLIDFNLRK